jgi:hypothetical protein
VKDTYTLGQYMVLQAEVYAAKACLIENVIAVIKIETCIFY